MLCLLMYSCEQTSLTPELTEQQNHELNERGGHCDLTQIPLYILPSKIADNSDIDFSAAFPVTKSTEYEGANGSEVTIQQVAYHINNSEIGNQFDYDSNVGYDLEVHVRYLIDNEQFAENFFLSFRVTSGQRIEWGETNFCWYESRDDMEVTINSRTIQSLILP